MTQCSQRLIRLTRSVSRTPHDSTECMCQVKKTKKSLCSRVNSLIVMTSVKLSTVLFLSVLVTLIHTGSCVQGTHVDYTRQCEPIRVELCRGIGYNVTAMPNFVGNELQADAEMQLASFNPLIQYGCSSQLKFFLCSVYTPMCSEKVPDSIGPCRPMCETVRGRCKPVLEEFGFTWPMALNCDRFPVANNNDHMCIEGPGEANDNVPSIASSPPAPVDHPDDVYPYSGGKGGIDLTPSLPASRGKGDCSHLRMSHEYFYVNRTETCVQKCNSDVLFSKENKAFAQNWLMFWSFCCFVSTLLAIILFIKDSIRFKYPERIIIIMAITSFMSSLGYLTRIVLGRESVSCYYESQYNIQLLIQEGPDNFYCTIVFVLLFYFSSATFIWWINLTITWYLSSVLHWSSEALERKSSYLHAIAWLLPALKTLIILIIRAVDSDELTGICFVGNHSSSTLLTFILIPGIVYIVIGCTFLLVRMYSLYNCTGTDGHDQCSTLTGLRTSNGHHTSHAHLSQTTLSSYCINNCNLKETDTLVNMYIGFITFSYLIFYVILMCGYTYEYLYRDLWYTNSSHIIPNMEFFTIKIFLSLVIGIIAGSWIWCSSSPSTFWPGNCSKFTKKQPLSPYLLPQVACASTFSVPGTPLSNGLTNVALANGHFGPFASSISIAPTSTLMPPHSYASLRSGKPLFVTTAATVDKRARGKGGETTV